MYVDDLLATDSAAALEFAKQLPASRLRDETISHLAKNWSRHDPASASEWIVGLPPGDGRDRALSQLITTSRDEPDSAFANASAISDDALRFSTAKTVVDWWKSRDPTAISSIVSESRLSDEEKAALIKLIHK